MNVPVSIVVPNSTENIYIDITTNGINTGGTGVSGTHDTFVSQIEPLILDPNKHYTVEVQSWYYQNSILGPDVYPILLSDIAQNIRVINTNSSILYKSSIPANDTNYYVRDGTNNAKFTLSLNKTRLSSISFQIVRSDDGEPFPMVSSVQLTLLIKD